MPEVPIKLFLKCCVCKYNVGDSYYVTLNEYVRIFIEWCNLVSCTSSQIYEWSCHISLNLMIYIISETPCTEWFIIVYIHKTMKISHKPTSFHCDIYLHKKWYRTRLVYITIRFLVWQCKFVPRLTISWLYGYVVVFMPSG